MYKYYNPHPKGLSTEDCVKRAIVVVTGLDYSKVQRELNEYKMVTGAKSFNSVKNLRYVEDILKARKISLDVEMTADEFCKNIPKVDIFLIWMSIGRLVLTDVFMTRGIAVRKK